MTTNFQPGDKVRVRPASAAVLGFTTKSTHTVAYVDDFGQISLLAVIGYFHPSHFELVERAAPAETYCLKDGDGDWWFFDNEDGYWYMVDGHLVRFSLFEGAEGIAGQYRIDDTPAAAPETYCLKDEAGDWWVSDGTDHFLVTPRGTYPTKVAPEGAAVHYGIDAEPLPSVAGVEVSDEAARKKFERAQARVDEFIAGLAAMTPTGNSTGPSLHFEADPAPLQPGEWVQVWAQIDGPGDSEKNTYIRIHAETTRAVTGAWVRNDAIVRPAEGQTPPWVEEPEREEVEAIAAALQREGGMPASAALQMAESLHRAGVRVTGEDER